MAIPDYQSLMLPVLRLTADQEQHALTKMREHIAHELGLSDQERSVRLSSGTQTVFANRIAWAVQYLKGSGSLETVRRGIYRITPRGISLIQNNPSEITLEALRQFPEFAEFEDRAADSRASLSPVEVESKKNARRIVSS